MTQPVMLWRTAVDSESELWTSTPSDSGEVDSETAKEVHGVTRAARLWGGRAVVEGTRIPVFMLVDLHEAGYSVDQIRTRYPHLSEADVWGALAHAGKFAGLINEDRASFVERLPKRRRL